MNVIHPFYPRDRSFFKGAISKGQQAQAAKPMSPAFQKLLGKQAPKPIDPMAPVNSASAKYVVNKNALGGESYSLLS
jgi:hypothetical protein